MHLLSLCYLRSSSLFLANQKLKLIEISFNLYIIIITHNFAELRDVLAQIARTGSESTYQSDSDSSCDSSGTGDDENDEEYQVDDSEDNDDDVSEDDDDDDDDDSEDDSEADSEDDDDDNYEDDDDNDDVFVLEEKGRY